MYKKIIIKLFVFILPILFISCASLGYRISGYKEVNFEWGSEIGEVYLDNRRINSKEIYYVNNAVHKIEWIQNNREHVYKIYFEKSGRYYIGDSRVYLLRRNVKIVN